MGSNSEENILLRERSGSIEYDDKLVSFLYELMRDHLTAGQVEALVRESAHTGHTIYTNGWLANYAKDLASRLLP